MTCPWCHAPRGNGPRCPKCGADYAKTELPPEIIRGKPAVDVAKVVAAVDVKELSQRLDGAGRYERLLPLVALPAALAAAYVVVAGELAQLFTRGFARMVNHELGHAVVAWLCGHLAIPTIMKTLVLGRSFIWSLVFAAAMGALVWLGRRAGNKALMGIGSVLLVLGLAGSLVSDRKAEELILFGGEGAGMMVAAGFMAWFCAGPSLYLRGVKRWMLLVLGSLGFMEMWLGWWRSRRNPGLIPFGENEYVGRSDATRLTEDFGWTVDQLVNRHVAAGVFCLIVLALVYAWSIWRRK